MVRWGIIGAGNIAHRFAKALKHEPDSELTAISARKKEKADAFGDEFTVAKRYVSHDDLLADKEIDAVYIALPHDMHCEWAIKSMKAGKAVLCEKPAVLNYGEMKQIADCAKMQKLLFMEAMKTRFVPCYAVLKKKLLEEKVIGAITRIDTSLCNTMSLDEIGNTYHVKPVVGGALLDCGIYCASWLEDFCMGEFTVRSVDYRMENGVDFYVNAELTAGDLVCSLETAFDRDKPRQAVIYGITGRVVVDNLHRTERFTIYADGKEPEQITVKYDVDDFYSQIHHFCDLLARGVKESPVMSLDNSLKCAELMDMIKAKLV